MWRVHQSPLVALEVVALVLTGERLLPIQLQVQAQ
jgi:hypothetical protein